MRNVYLRLHDGVTDLAKFDCVRWARAGSETVLLGEFYGEQDGTNILALFRPHAATDATPVPPWEAFIAKLNDAVFTVARQALPAVVLDARPYVEPLTPERGRSLVQVLEAQESRPDDGKPKPRVKFLLGMADEDRNSLLRLIGRKVAAVEFSGQSVAIMTDGV